MKDVSFFVDKQKLKGTLFYPKPLRTANPAILFLHGWTSSEIGYKPRAEALAKLGFICLTFDLRGHGKSDGKLEDFSINDHLKDAVAAFDFLASQENADKNKIGVVGASYGGYLASILSSKRSVKWLTLRAPAIYPDGNFNRSTVSVLKDETKFFNEMGSGDKNNSACRAISKFNGNILIIESKNDEIIPHKIIEAYINCVKDKNLLTHKVIKNADHPLLKEEYKKEFIKIMVDWLKVRINKS